MDDVVSINHFKYFLAKNERRVNGYFRHILWYSCIAGPVIALGVFLGAFPEVTYWVCAQTAFVTLFFAIGHTYLYKYKPESELTKYFGLIGLLFTLGSMCASHIIILLTYFMVPLVSLLYCNRRVYVVMSILSYVMLLLTNVMIAEYTANLRVNYDDALSYFVFIVGGETIEFSVMFTSGYFINKLMIDHLRTMYANEIALDESEREAHSDQLTGLWNRRYLDHAFDKFVVVQRHKAALLIIDMDNMKLINDSFGHLEGDRALKVLARTLKKNFNKYQNTAVCRYGGDEFVVLIPNVESISELTPYISEMMAKVNETFGKDEKLNDTSVSVGAAFTLENDLDYKKVFARADKALYDVKKLGRNSFQIYTEA